MKTCLTILFVLLGAMVFGQKMSKPKTILPLPSPVIVLQDDQVAKQYLHDMYVKSLRQPNDPGNGDKMPNGFTGKVVMGPKKGNNGKGFDIYESNIDNMTILMPDSLNALENRLKMPSPGRN